MSKFLITIFALTPLISLAQFNDTIQLPVIEQLQHSVFISETGSDSNAGDSLNPVATFQTALNKLDSVTTGQTGDVFAEVVLYAGTYHFALAQAVSKFQISSKNLNVSVRGKDEVILDGNGLTLSGGQGMVSLLGSHISVKNLKIIYSPSNGVRFGYDYMGTVINPHDILIEDVEVAQTAGHGILVGIGALNSANPLTLTPHAERFLIRNCYVHHAVNFNLPQTQWGSAIKFHNVRHGKAVNCLVHDNSGEGIDVDFGQYIEISDNKIFDNYANVYLDKAENIIIRNNLIYTTHRRKTGILLGIEPFTGLLTDFYVKDIIICNNIILNTPTGISIWQGTYSAIQNGHFSNIKILHNTITGKTVDNGGAIAFSFFTAFGQPGNNVLFSNLEIKNNIVSAHPDSLNNGRLVNGPLNPQPALTSAFNLWNIHPVIAFDSTDRIDSLLPVFINPLEIETLVPHIDSNSVFVFSIPREDFADDDYNHTLRFPDSTNAGAFELDTTLYSDTTIIIGIYDHDKSLLVYPNPFSSIAQIRLDDLNSQEFSIELFDVNGKKIPANFSYRGNAIFISRGNLEAGVYFFQIMTAGKLFTGKLVVK
ncbi:MAG: right-handed parallel beta-helix repeat-containing protein [Chitinophagales bacterium]|nr:right-handed parallel beta-helix repeat-containing protein [Chitinophagales bacterium]